MRIRIPDRDVLLMDKAIKINVAATGNYAEAQNLLSRCIWNICFQTNSKERKRSLKILDDICKNSKYKDMPECQGGLPK